MSDRLAIPVATTNMGKGVIREDAPLALGVFGNCMEPGAPASALRVFATEADAILLLGTRTNANGTDGWTLFPPDAHYIHIDVDAAELGRNYEALSLCGDVKATVAALDAELRAIGAQPVAGRRDHIAAATEHARRKSRDALDRLGPGTSGRIRPEHLLRTLDRVLGPDDIVTADASYATNWVSTFLSAARDGTRFLEPRGLAGLGWGLPLAMGAKLARPGANVFALVGDGGFAHCWSELETARRLGIRVVTIVLNNQILGYQLHGEDHVFDMHSDASELGPVDHAAIARACDCDGERVVEPDAFEAALARAIASDRPSVIDVLVDPDARPPLSIFGDRPDATA